MIIGISATGKSMSGMLDPRFGRCRCFVIHDTNTNANEFIGNAAMTASGGAGIAAAQEMINRDVEAVITGNVGPNAFNVLNNAGIKVYRCGSVTIENAIQLFRESKLSVISEAGPAHAGMGRRGGF